MANGTILVQQSDIVLATFGLVIFFFLLVLAVFAGAFFFVRLANMPAKGASFQAPMDFLGEDDLPGSIGVESGSHSFQAPDGEEGPPTEAEVRARKEYREAMNIVDRQVERATRQVLGGKPVRLDHEFFSGPYQATAPGVKDE